MRRLNFIFSPMFMGTLFVIFAVAMAAATFVENDYGATAAYHAVYGTKWFEFLLLLLAVNLVGQLVIFGLFRKTRLPGALFHLAFVVMLAGAAITRYTGWEGSIRIREGEMQNRCFSTQKYLGYTVKDQSGNVVERELEQFTPVHSRRDLYKSSFETGGTGYKLVLSRIIPNAVMELTDDPSGEPMISLYVTSASMQEGETLYLKKGDFKTSSGITIGFESQHSADLNIRIDSGRFRAMSLLAISETSMMTRETRQIAPGTVTEMVKMQILNIGSHRVITRGLSMAAVMQPVSVDPAQQNTGRNAFVFNLDDGKERRNIFLFSSESADTASATAHIENHTLRITYGSEVVELPFALKLNDFILERYPGSNSPSGYKSDVVLLHSEANIEKPFMIYMNNILKYKGYRFYQSSYDQDEMGTVLSVNHDVAGMLVTYAGYGLLFLFIILSLINRNSIFHKVNPSYWSSSLRKAVTMITVLLIIPLSGAAQELVPDRKSADEFGKVLVQDQKGRTKPLFTLSSDIVRKITKDNNFRGNTPMQVFLGVYLDFMHWKDVPMIKIGSSELRQKLGISGDLAAFTNLVNLNANGAYIISADVEKAYSKAPGQRSKYDKEVMKVDERVNILYMIYTGNFMRMFPLKTDSHDWGKPEEALRFATSAEDSVFLKGVVQMLAGAVSKGNPDEVKKIAEAIAVYQETHSEYSLPDDSRVKAEVLYYRLNIFEKLFPYYATVGILMLVILVAGVIKGASGKNTGIMIRVARWLLFAGFFLHTSGLALRWYISGHSPMSNGYESMLFISWVTLLAGFIFSRKSHFALSATAVLGSMTLLVAHMSFMDPEITNLVPVLKSYWLTLHVSVITGSYGFLGLGAILGLITLILISLANTDNRSRISDTIDELTVINYRTLTVGLYLLTIGTFLGAIWANESWGRYWGWDPKETWSLITIVVYSFVIHSRMIPGMKDLFVFNLGALIAFSSVLMTYFGVNYYLSGLHSYAGGDPVPLPAFVYIAVAVLVALALYSGSRYRKMAR